MASAFFPTSTPSEFVNCVRTWVYFGGDCDWANEIFAAWMSVMSILSCPFLLIVAMDRRLVMYVSNTREKLRTQSRFAMQSILRCRCTRSDRECLDNAVEDWSVIELNCRRLSKFHQLLDEEGGAKCVLNRTINCVDFKHFDWTYTLVRVEDWWNNTSTITGDRFPSTVVNYLGMLRNLQSE